MTIEALQEKRATLLATARELAAGDGDYFASNHEQAVRIALARGKQQHDKREDLKKRDAERETRAGPPRERPARARRMLEHADDAALRDRGQSLLLTYWPSEFSQVRGQYRHTSYGEGIKANEFLFQFQIGRAHV